MLEQKAQIFNFLSHIFLGISRRLRYKEVIERSLELGVSTLPLLTVISLFMGMVLAVHTYLQFKPINMDTYTGTVVAMLLILELGPVLSAIMLAARCGSAIAAEIASMRINEQLDALETLAVPPIEYLVSARFICAVFTLPVLTLYTNFIGILGSYIMGVYKYGIAPKIYINNSFFLLNSWDVISGLVKSAVFGGLVVFISAWIGFRAHGSAHGISAASRNAVVQSCIGVIIADYILTLLLF